MAPENWEGEQALVQKVVKMAWREVLGGGLLRYFFLFHKTENLIMPAFFCTEGLLSGCVSTIRISFITPFSSYNVSGFL
jgi:hypothetical protein